jgi:hypothetical protein
VANGSCCGLQCHRTTGPSTGAVEHLSQGGAPRLIDETAAEVFLQRPAPADLNSCELVTKAQAETVMGTKMQEGVHVANPDLDTCTYAGDPSGPTAQFEVFVGAGAKTFYDDDNTVLQHTFTDVPGLGDESHEEEFALFFRKGTTWVALRLTSLDEFSLFKTRLEDLGKEVAAQI